MKELPTVHLVKEPIYIQKKFYTFFPSGTSSFCRINPTWCDRLALRPAKIGKSSSDHVFLPQLHNLDFDQPSRDNNLNKT